MKKFFIGLFLISGVFGAFAQPQRSEADALCYQTAAPTPIPTTGAINLGICDSTGHLLVTGAAGATPIPYPTNTSGVLLVQPTNVPTIGVTVVNTPTVTCPTCPTPVPYATSAGSTLNVVVTNPTAFPTPIPFPTLGVNVLNTPTVNQGTSPWIVNTPAPYPTTAGTLTLKVDGSAVTQPVSGTLTVNTPPPTTTVTVTQGTGTNLHAVIDSGAITVNTPAPYATSAGGFLLVAPTALPTLSVINVAGAAVIGKVGIDQTTAGTTNLVQAKVCDTTTATTCATVDTSGRLSVTNKLTNGTILTSASATTCTNILAAASRGLEIINSGPATTIFPQFYNDAGATCAAGTLLYGDGSTLVIGAGQIIRIDYPMAGIAYKLSGSLTTNLAVTGL